MAIDAIAAIGNIDPSVATEFVKPSAEPGFSEMISNHMEGVNSSLNAAETVLTDMALNKPVSAHEVMLTMENAKKELRLVVEVRNKLLEGYQELMRMQV